MNRAIVTGGNGFVGSHLVCALAEKGVKVYAIIKDEYENIEFIKNHQNVQIIYCDLFHLEQLKEKILFDKGDQSIDLFYHLAWAGTSGN
ncbi:MAG: NAD-dependent epimerase/dehydratase family protein, partial [Eubacterium sp.]